MGQRQRERERIELVINWCSNSKWFSDFEVRIIIHYSKYNTIHNSGVGAVAAMAATLFTNVNLLMFIVINIHKLLIMNNN